MSSATEREELTAPAMRVVSIRPLHLLLIFLGTMLVVAELISRSLHDHRPITLNIEQGVREALAIRHEDARAQVLVAGNSLVFEDLSQSRLQQSMGRAYAVHVAGAPGSTYYDWEYGLMSLFARGSRPDIVVFGISPSQFLREPATTPLIVSKLWRVQDILQYRRENNVSLSLSSELLFEHYSTFFYMRDTIRLYTRSFLPGYASMIDGWNSFHSPGPTLGAETAGELMVRRLSSLAQECGRESKLVVMIAPTGQREDVVAEPALKAAAKKLGIFVIEPVGETEWPSTSFRDGYHLNLAAANEFSGLVGASLVHALEGAETRRKE